MMNFYMILIIFVILSSVIYIILFQIDLNTDYSNRKIQYYFHADNGFYINVP